LPGSNGKNRPEGSILLSVGFRKTVCDLSELPTLQMFAGKHLLSTAQPAMSRESYLGPEIGVVPGAISHKCEPIAAKSNAHKASV